MISVSIAISAQKRVRPKYNNPTQRLLINAEQNMAAVFYLRRSTPQAYQSLLVTIYIHVQVDALATRVTRRLALLLLPGAVASSGKSAVPLPLFVIVQCENFFWL